MKQVLGQKKHQRCEQIAGKSYRVCYANGARDHFWAQCWFGDGETLRDYDDVNYKTGEVVAACRGGQLVAA